MCVPNGEPKCEECPVKRILYCVQGEANDRDTGKEKGKNQKDRRKNHSDIQRR